jgi:tetratricopeptide (TPR) repeat protein
MNANHRIRLAASSRQGLSILVAVLLLSVGCSKSENGTGPDEPTAAEDLAAGWTAFEAHDYVTARTRFGSAISKDATLADAYNGLGWCQAILNNLSPAATAFQDGLTRDSTLIDAVAGLAFVYRDLPNLDQAILRGEAVPTANASWQFSHMTSVNSRDVRVVIAQAYFLKGEANFSESQAQVDALDPTNGLNPGNSSTWLVGGTLYNTYAEALLMKIEELAATEATP